MKHLLLVWLGGGLGSVARLTLGSWVLHHLSGWRFPVGTFVVNMAGCLMAGIFSGLFERQNSLDPDIKLFIFAGILGGFTTFSAFGVETVHLVRRGDLFFAVLNVLLSVVCGLSVLWFGMKISFVTHP